MIHVPSTTRQCEETCNIVFSALSYYRQMALDGASTLFLALLNTVSAVLDVTDEL